MENVFSKHLLSFKGGIGVTEHRINERSTTNISRRYLLIVAGSGHLLQTSLNTEAQGKLNFCEQHRSDTERFEIYPKNVNKSRRV